MSRELWAGAARITSRHAIAIESLTDEMADNGRAFYFSFSDTFNAAGSPLIIVQIETGASAVLFAFRVASSGNADILFFEDVVSTGGTPQSLHNLNRNSAILAPAVVTTRPTVSNVGTQLSSFIARSGDYAFELGKSLPIAWWVLKPNSKYGIQVLSVGASRTHNIDGWIAA
jgi:hypothetical protein